MTLSSDPADRNGQDLSIEEKLRRLNEHHVNTVGAPPPAEVVDQVAAAQSAQVDEMIRNAATGRSLGAGAGSTMVPDAMRRGMATAAAMGGHAYRVIGAAANPGMVTMHCDHCGDTKVGIDPR